MFQNIKNENGTKRVEATLSRRYDIEKRITEGKKKAGSECLEILRLHQASHVYNLGLVKYDSMITQKDIEILKKIGWIKEIDGFIVCPFDYTEPNKGFTLMLCQKNLKHLDYQKYIIQKLIDKLSNINQFTGFTLSMIWYRESHTFQGRKIASKDGGYLDLPENIIAFSKQYPDLILKINIDHQLVNGEIGDYEGGLLGQYD